MRDFCVHVYVQNVYYVLLSQVFVITMHISHAAVHVCLFFYAISGLAAHGLKLPVPLVNGSHCLEANLPASYFVATLRVNRQQSTIVFSESGSLSQ